jgi:hypothetical protein
MQIGFTLKQQFDSVFKNHLNKKMGQFCLNLFLENYTKQGYLDGTGKFIKWKPLSAKYEAIKARKKPGYPIGVYSTDLKQGFNIKYNSRGFKISNNTEYADDFNEVRPILYTDTSIDAKMVEFIDKEMSKIFTNMAKKISNK